MELPFTGKSCRFLPNVLLPPILSLLWQSGLQSHLRISLLEQPNLTGVQSVICFVAPASVASSPEFIELIYAQGGNKRMGQLCHGPRLPKLQPTVDTPQVAHPLRAEKTACRIEEDEAQHRRVAGVLLLNGLQPLGEARSRQADHVQLAEQSFVIGTDLLVDLDTVVLDGDSAPSPQ